MATPNPSPSLDPRAHGASPPLDTRVATDNGGADTKAKRKNTEDSLKPSSTGSVRLLLCCGSVIAAFLFVVPAVVLWRSSGGVVTGGGEALAAIAAEPATPPPPHSATLATVAPAATAESTDTAERVAAAVSQAETVLTALPFTGRAPPELVVAPGLQRAAVVKDVPPHERWEIDFPPGNSLESYARQLDYFGIELGVVGGSSQITYLTNLSDPAPDQRTAPAADESRLYLVWTRGAMREADVQLAARAKLHGAEKTFVHFLPAELEAELLRLEEAEAARRNLQHVRKTTFGIRSNGFGGFQFYVLDQQGDRA